MSEGTTARRVRRAKPTSLLCRNNYVATFKKKVNRAHHRLTEASELRATGAARRLNNAQKTHICNKIRVAIGCSLTHKTVQTLALGPPKRNTTVCATITRVPFGQQRPLPQLRASRPPLSQKHHLRTLNIRKIAGKPFHQSALRPDRSFLATRNTSTSSPTWSIPRRS